ncbi:GspMb/PilO family protein [Bacillus sp. 1P06AnD]|uniref:GspMb/PilO family protein n=1 Tax=Bacillus sp. 1P06AnD TaxID=3132208 RepID=UPI0039A3D9F9
MNNSLSKKHMLIVVGFSLAAAGLIAGIFFWKVYPLQSMIGMKQDELSNQERLLTSIQLKAAPVKEVSFEKSTELQKKLPVKPLTQQLILNIEKAETISGSFVQNLSFAEEGSGEGEAGDNPPSAATSAEGLEKVSISLNVQSPTYEKLNDFLDTIEGMQRLLTIDQLTFTGEEETTSVEQSASPLDFTVNLSAYYAPGLQDLQKDVPEMADQTPAGKANPFNNHEGSDR